MEERDASTLSWGEKRKKENEKLFPGSAFESTQNALISRWRLSLLTRSLRKVKPATYQGAPLLKRWDVLTLRTLGEDCELLHLFTAAKSFHPATVDNMLCYLWGFKEDWNVYAFFFSPSS